MKKVLKLLLLIVIVLLGWVVYRQFATPMEFTRTRKQREAAVIERLKDIRTAQRAYKQEHQRYTPSFDTLIRFILNDSLEYIRAIGSEDDSVAVARGLTKMEKFKMAVKDTIYSGRGFTTEDIEALEIIPYSNGQKFIMDAGNLQTESKVVVNVFVAKAPYKTFLGDLDQQELINLIDERKSLEKYPGLWVGSTTEATNVAGNWE